MARARRTGHCGGMRLLKWLVRYPVVTLTIIVGAFVLILDASGADRTSKWLAIVYVSMVIVWTLIGMIRDVLRGQIGLDVLAVVAMIATPPVGA